MFRSLLIFCFVLAILVMAGGCYAQIAPVMTMSFDKGLDAQSANGAISPSVLGKAELAPGKIGQAFKSGPSTGYLEYPTTLLKASAGTVEMWVCPVDWVPQTVEFHTFFDMRGPDGALYLYKYFQYSAILMLSCENPAGPYFSTSSPIQWKPGEWHHIAGTWSSNGVMSYVDGKPAGAVPVEALLPKALSKTFMIGDNPWHLPRTSSSLIDEVRIYDRALSAAHIAAHFAGDYNFQAPLTEKSLYLHYELDPIKQELAVKVNTGGADVTDDQVTGKVALVAKGAAMPADSPVLKFNGGQMLTSLKVDVSKAVTYDLVAQVTPKGGQMIEVRRDIIVPDTVIWRDNKLGTEDKVLSPWTPVNGKTPLLVKVWDRSYDFRSAGLINQIISGKQSLLAAPIQLRQTIDGASTIIGAVSENKMPHTSTRAIVNKKLSQGNTSLSMQATVEYDGLAVFKLSGKIDPKVEALTLDIPVRNEIALYRHRSCSEWNSSRVTGNLPAGSGVIDNNKFIPFYWLGNNDRGLFWMCESDETWPNSDDPNAIQVVRENGQTILRLNLLVKGQKLPENWHFAFGLQATPVKPIPADWRKWRLQPALNGNINIMWPTIDKGSNKYYGYPEATDPKLMAGRVTELHTKKISAVPYLCLSFISAACPEWPFFRKYWAMGPIDASSADVATYGAGFAMASPVSKSYVDFIVWKTTQFIKQFGIDGLYHDNTQPYGSTNLDAGCGYIRDGQLRQTYPIFGYRDLYRRMYGVMKSIRPKGFTMAHMSGTMIVPVLAYDDSYLDGEYFRGLVKDCYTDIISLDTFRAEFMGRQWGVIPYFLPEFDEEHAIQTEPTRGLMAILMLHDVSPWLGWSNVGEANKALSALDKFGYVKSKFIGYFDKEAPGFTNMQDVYVSAYKKMNGKTLLVVGNVSKEDRQGQVTINPNVIGHSIKTVITWPDKQPVAIKDNKISLSVSRLGYQLLVVN